MRWRKAAEARRARAEVVIDLRARLAPYLGEADDDWDDSFETVVAPVRVMETAGAPGPYRPRHLAT